MDKEKIIIVAILIIVVIAIIFEISNSNKNNTSKNNNFNYQSEEVETLDVEEKASIETNFNEAVSKARDMYKTYGSQNFSVYFNTEFVNNYMKNGSLSIIDNIDIIDFDWVNIYDIDGNKIEEFPTTFSDEKEIQYENESYQIEANKKYLLRIYSNTNFYCYYYILSYDKNGYASLKEICYTIGETAKNIYDVVLDEEIIE
jgi:hypothetical protein